nr:MAG TPA: hypothetical protein [Caudoviricetes sp.]
MPALVSNILVQDTNFFKGLNKPLYSVIVSPV